MLKPRFGRARILMAQSPPEVLPTTIWAVESIHYDFWFDICACVIPAGWKVVPVLTRRLAAIDISRWS